MKRLNTAPANPAGEKKYPSEPKAGDPVRRCKLCKRSKLKREFRSWTIRVTRRGSKVDEVRRSWTCIECEDAQERASAIVASTRPQRAERYSTDSAALAVVDVRRLISAAQRLPG